MNFFVWLRTTKQLGWRNCAAVAIHRLASRIGVHKRQYPIQRCPVPEELVAHTQLAPFTSEPWFEASSQACLLGANSLLGGFATWYDNDLHDIGSPPDWFFDPASGQHFPDGSQHWSQCKPFATSDIKNCWELSRWGWAPLLARAWRISGHTRFLDELNVWSKSWCEANPLNGGSNWLCGQEASIRLLHALQAWKLSDAMLLIPAQTPERSAFVVAHLQRIFATKHYAQAQSNNHWTSEAAALFIGANWLSSSACSNALVIKRWAKAGRHELERSVRMLVLPDGSFSQHSLNYHRLLLDTLVQVELWRRWLGQEAFSKKFYQLCSAATSWLQLMVDPVGGDGPNLGHNDGAFCYQLHSQPYRDYRPCIQLASVVFCGNTALPSGPWDEPLIWLGLLPVNPALTPFRSPALTSITLFANGGYAVLRPSTTSWALLRIPTYRFRPAHADPLHLDLWHKGVNILRDGGSYSYNAAHDDLVYFPGIASHNTLQFDDAEPMPRLGRFLWGSWLQPEGRTQVVNNSVTASYRCGHGFHRRCVNADTTGCHWRITDNCSDFSEKVVLRWRLCPGDWQLKGSSLIGPMAILQIRCDQPITRSEIVTGWESRYYGSKTPLTVFELEISQAPATIITSIHFSS